MKTFLQKQNLRRIPETISLSTGGLTQLMQKQMLSTLSAKNILNWATTCPCSAPTLLKSPLSQFWQSQKTPSRSLFPLLHPSLHTEAQGTIFTPGPLYLLFSPLGQPFPQISSWWIHLFRSLLRCQLLRQAFPNHLIWITFLSYLPAQWLPPYPALLFIWHYIMCLLLAFSL